MKKSFKTFLVEFEIEDSIKKLSIRPSTGEPGPNIYTSKIMKLHDIEQDPIQELLYDNFTKYKYKKKKINIDDLVLTQANVKTENLLKIAKEFSLSKTNIFVVNYKNVNYVVDGTHSVIVTKLMGHKNILVNFIKL